MGKKDKEEACVKNSHPLHGYTESVSHFSPGGTHLNMIFKGIGLPDPPEGCRSEFKWQSLTNILMLKKTLTIWPMGNKRES